MQERSSSLFLLAAITGFGISLTIHVISYIVPEIIGTFAYSYALHFFALLLVIPTIGALDQINQPHAWDNIWHSLRQKNPQVLQLLAAFLFAYALFNFFYNFMVLNEGAQVCIAEGEYVLASKDGILKKLSTNDYFLHKAYSLRTDSAYWLFFFYLQSVLLYTALQSSHK